MIEIDTIDPPMVTSNRNEHSKNSGFSVPKIVAAGLSGLAGGAVVAIAIAGGGAGLAIAIIGSLAGAAITGSAEYSREKKRKAHS